jgi:hypothetical protein
MEPVEETSTDSAPAIRYRVTAISDAGRLILWLSDNAANQLAEYLLKLPGGLR